METQVNALAERESPRAVLRQRGTWLCLAGLILYGLASLLMTSRQFGMSWDEGYYYPAYEDAREWIGQVFSNPGAAFSSEGIRAGWEEIHELPPVTKWLQAPLTAFGEGWGKLAVLRVVPAMAFCVTLTLLFLTARRRAPWPWALLAAGAFGLHPRLWGHGHFAATETIFCAVTALVLFLADSDLSRWSRRLLLAGALGLALATKVNGLILMVAVGAWLGWRMLRNGIAWRRTRGTEHAAAVRSDLRTALSLFLAPLVAWALWPWMWDDTAERLAEYWTFITEHSHQGIWYLGQRWNFPPGVAERVPWHYVPVMILVASPEVFLLLALAGVGAALAPLAKRQAPDSFLVLLLLAMAGPLAANMLPTSPKYDGLRLFLPAFVPMSLLIGSLGERLRSAGRVPQVAGALLLATAAPFLVQGLGYYNPTTRLLTRGQEEFPFELTYWGESVTPEVLEELAALDPDARVKTLALHASVLQLQQDWGVLPPGMVIDGEPPYDLHLLQNRKGFWGNTEWWFFLHRRPLAMWPGEDPRMARLLLYDGRPPGVGDENPEPLRP